MRKVFVAIFAVLSLTLSLFIMGCGSSSSSTPAATIAPDTTAPTVSSTSPAADDIDVALNATVSVTFSESLDATTVGDATLTLLADGETDPVMATVAYSDGMYKVECDPNYQLATDTLYHATLTATVADLAGNMLAEELTWSFFTTATDLSPPDIAEVFPADGGVANTLTLVSVTYSEENSEEPTDGSFTLTCGGVDVTGTANYAGLTQAVFTPDAALTVGDSCTAAFSGTLEDASANSGMASATWSFTVGYPLMTDTPVAAGPVGAGTPVDITVPLNGAADCVSIVLSDGVDNVGGGAGCKAAVGDTEAVVSVDTDPGPGGDYYIQVQAYHSTGGPESDYVYDDTISLDNYAWSTSDMGILEDSGIPLGMATLVPMPDLTIEVLAVDDYGSQTLVWYEACNDGYAEAGPFEVAVFVDPGTPPQVGDTADGYGGIYGLPAGWCEVDSIFAQGEPGLPGTYIYAIVDSAQDVDESSETNNIDSYIYAPEIIFDFEIGFHPELSGTWYRDTSNPGTGLASARGQDIGANGSTTMQYVTPIGYSTVSFQYKVSCESHWDRLTFYIDGVRRNYWSGNSSWTTSPVYSLDPNTTHTLKWSYTKDSSNSHYSDTAWVDEIIILN